ncbi:MAG: tetratricopeptide repeat protein, partial [Saprospiraceae bacterium]|nr:tetratricopeptide repeat protein [Saprospiraceae bacterium]
RNTSFLDKLAYLQVLAGQPKDALNTLEQIEKITGITEATADKKHLIYLGLGDVKKAVGELQKLVNAYPTRVAYRHRIAQVYESAGDKAAARKVYEEILRIAPDDETAKMALLAERKSGGSVVADLQALRPVFQDPKISMDSKVKQVMPYFSQMAKGLPADAVALLLELGDIAQKTHPDDAKAWSLSGDLYYHANRPDEALVRYRTCIRLNPRVFSVWANTLEILHSKGDYDELLRLSERAMDDFPNQPLAYYYHGVAALEKGRPDDALPVFEQANLMTVNNPALTLDIADQMGRALLLKKDYAAAQKHYEQFLSKGGDRHPGLLEHYGDALYWLGRQAQALEYWRKAAQIAPSPRLEQKISSGRL